MTDSQNAGGRLYRSAGAKHPDAVPAPRGRRAVNPDRFDFLETTEPSKVFEPDHFDGELPGEFGLRGWQLFILVTAPTLVVSLIESMFSKSVGVLTFAVFVIACVLGAFKTRAESSYATWTTPALAFATVSFIGSALKFSASAGLLGNIAAIGLEFFTRLSAAMWPVLGATLVCWFLGRRTLVAYRAARYRAQRRRVRD